ncbi:unnamed protein product [Didymodactylos carnosus]|uniref:Letm1 RBD domain-containing protein n=1 Tax=Didymodactylos carnosus TaxID=1234261 RepID=A0A814T8F4_9BILA|nr:unnamed protein product [Didymodactylos carnosus]CAF1157372.1 unnamed protein product [Didymodactylos carnosus]CAF3742463.1 unnamed protein product [Didymodactylos carnosus]CAF3920808.1 unnamed protein product [Didymodactylos carnosus]
MHSICIRNSFAIRQTLFLTYQSTQTTSPFHSHLVNYRFSSSNSNSTPQKRSVNNLFKQFRQLLHHYFLGSKLLFSNYKQTKLIREQKMPLRLTRPDRNLLTQFRSDLIVGIPFISLFMAPIIGYTAPLLAFIAPRYLPSTLITPNQKSSFVLNDSVVSSEIVQSLINQFDTNYDDEMFKNVIPLRQCVEELLSSKIDSINFLTSSIPLLISSFESYPLSSFSREHLLLLHRSLVHSSFIAEYVLTKNQLINSLEQWKEKITYDDYLLTKGKENLNELTSSDLVQTLYDRGLYLHPQEMAQVLQQEQNRLLTNMKKKRDMNEIISEPSTNLVKEWQQLLSTWLKLYKNNNIPTSLLVHLGPFLTTKKR